MGCPKHRSVDSPHGKGYHPAAHLQRCVFPTGVEEEQGSEMGVQDRRFFRTQHLDGQQQTRNTYEISLYICTIFKRKGYTRGVVAKPASPS